MAEAEENQRQVAERFVTLHEFVKAARLKLSAENWDFLIGGTESETTLRRNRLALDSLAFRPRVLRDVSRIDPSATIFGRKSRLPVLLAPVGSLHYFHPEGAAAVAKAASAFGIPQMLSSVGGLDPEIVAAAATGRKIFQLYVRGDRAWVDSMVQRAIDAGYEAFCFTVDAAVYSRRERDVAKRVVKRSASDPEADNYQAALSWDEVRRFKDKYDIPLIIKGIATAEDAILACDNGVNGIHVSNHGGRQLDHGQGAIEMLPEIVEAVRGRAQIIVDGGFNRGTDIIKALILGADAVAIGRLYLYGLAAAGVAGVRRILELLEMEIVTSLGLLGVSRFADLDKSYLCPAAPVTVAHTHGAFPLLNLADEGYSAP